ncbi:methionyl-tRNA formyltransferase [Agrobacterium vitis]|uniref:Methionyl-tRNA formyltransferase n=2 Tax=Agrobacterium vitis TaxID=373 RepID=A0A6L6VEA8_AGRVI|nr:methionyl-tRNA formyltransferase [Agrobacterium vitis]MVA17704.1 methionyl-tRNA formyltransferase [Agrobacterium vitis]
MERNSLHDDVSATYSVFGQDERLVLQIDTYGSLERKIPGKKSQTIQFDRNSAEQLFKILKDEFLFK